MKQISNNIKTNKETNFKRVPILNMNMILYLDYFNNFLSVERFAEYYGYSVIRANEILIKGKNDHENRVKQLNKKV